MIAYHRRRHYKERRGADRRLSLLTQSRQCLSFCGILGKPKQRLIRVVAWRARAQSRPASVIKPQTTAANWKLAEPRAQVRAEREGGKRLFERCTDKTWKFSLGPQREGEGERYALIISAHITNYNRAFLGSAPALSRSLTRKRTRRTDNGQRGCERKGRNGNKERTKDLLLLFRNYDVFVDFSIYLVRLPSSGATFPPSASTWHPSMPPRRPRPKSPPSSPVINRHLLHSHPTFCRRRRHSFLHCGAAYSNFSDGGGGRAVSLHA